MVDGYSFRGAAVTADAAIGAGRAAVRITGEFDLCAEARATAMVTRVLDDHPDVRALTLDLSDVTFFDSSGVRFLTGIYACCELADIAVELRPSPAVEQVLALAALI
jgi:anti-anti-sigma factor